MPTEEMQKHFMLLLWDDELLTMYLRQTNDKGEHDFLAEGMDAITLSEAEDTAEDLVYLDVREWTDAMQNEATILQTNLDILQEEKQKGVRSNPPRYDVQKIPKGRHRNAPCICGSGKKYKKCCGKRSVS